MELGREWWQDEARPRQRAFQPRAEDGWTDMKDWIDQLWRTLRGPVMTVAALAAVLVLVQLLSVFVHTLSSADLYVLGIRPRDWTSLTGVFTSPLVHYGFGHLFANLAPLCVLALLILLEGQRRFWWVTGLVLLCGGVVLWVLGPGNRVYLGASSLVFGYLGYVIVRALVTRDPIWIVAGFAVAVVYAGVVASLFTVSPHVSWVGHIASLLAGVFVAFRFPATKPVFTFGGIRKPLESDGPDKSDKSRGSGKPAKKTVPRTARNTGHGLD